MKKALSLVLVAMMLLSLMPVAIAADEVSAQVGYTDTGANLLIGGDFNNAAFGVGNFRKDYDAATLEYVPGLGVDGSGCVALTPSQTNGNVCMRYILADGYAQPLIAGHQYVMSFKVMNPSTNAGAWDWTNMEIRDGAVAKIYVHTGGVSKDAWHGVTSDVFTYDGNGSDLRIYCGYSNASAEDKLYFDDISIVDVTPVSGNMIANGDFESSTIFNITEKWTYDGGVCSLVSGVGVNGSDCMALNLQAKGEGKNNNAVLTWARNLAPGKTYILSCDVKLPAGNAEWVALDVEGNGLQTWDNALLRPMNKIIPDTWMTVTSIITVPEGVTDLPIRILAPMSETASGNDVMLIDNLSVRCDDPSVATIYAETYNEDLKGVNLLYNGDCNREDYTWNRTDWQGADFAWSATEGVNGSGAWVGTPKDAAQSGCVVAMPAGIGKQFDAYRLYEFSVKVWRSADCNASTRLEIKTAEDGWLGWAAFATKTEEWETLTYRYWTDADPKNLTAMVITDAGFTTGTVKVDDFAIRELGAAERFGVVDFVGAHITDIAGNVVTVDLTFGAPMTFITNNIMLCNAKNTNGCNAADSAQYQYGVNTLTAKENVQEKNGKTYATTWTATFNTCGCEQHPELWSNGMPENCVVRITDWMGSTEATENKTLDERMVIAANVAEGINGERVAAEYIDAGMDVAWVKTTAKVAATVNGVSYTSFAAAMANATSGSEVKLFEDQEVSGFCEIGSGVTLDLNGYSLTTDNLFSFGHIKDSSNGNAGLFVSNDRKKAFVQLQEDNVALPLYDSANGCYRFFDYTLEAKVAQTTASYAKYALHLDLPNATGYSLLMDEANKDMVTMRLFVNKDDGTTQTMDYFFMDSTIEAYANQSMAELNVKKGIFLTVSGLDRAGGVTLTATAHVASVTGVAIDAVMQ